MIRHLLLLTAGFLGAIVARDALRPLPSIPVSDAPALLAPRFTASPAAVAGLEDLLARARQPSRTPAQLMDLQRAVDRWLLADPMACIAWLQDRRATGLIRADLLRTVCAFAFGGRMNEILRHALQISDPLLHYAFITAGFEAAAELRPAEAFEAMATLPAAKRVKLGDEIVSRWARKDPRKAWAAVSANSNPEEVLRLVGPCMMAWDTIDPRGLREFLRQQLVAPDHSFALEFGLWSLAERPSTALEVLSGFEQYPRLRPILQRALMHSADNAPDSQAALRFARSQPPGPLRQSALFALGLGLSQSDNAGPLPEVLAELTPDARRALEPARRNGLFRFPPSKVSALLSEQPEDEFFQRITMSQYVGAVCRYQSQALVEMALNAEPPEQGPDWLDMIAAQVRTDPLSSKPGDAAWLEKLDPPTRERLRLELQRRLTLDDWTRVEGYFRTAEH